MLGYAAGFASCDRKVGGVSDPVYTQYCSLKYNQMDFDVQFLWQQWFVGSNVVSAHFSFDFTMNPSLDPPSKK